MPALKNLLCLVLFLTFLLVFADREARAQDAAAQDATAEDATTEEATAEEAAAEEEEAPVANPPIELTGNWNRLVHPEVADELGLDDQQRAQIQSLLSQRSESSASPEVEDKAQRIREIEQQIRDVLTADQWTLFSDRGETKDLRFQFREQPWGDVLQWFASQQGLTLVMNQVPPGHFTYTDTRSYSAAEAIDLLNSVLLTRGFTLVRREKMLTVLQLSNSIPIELVPRVRLEELPSRGKFELISMLFSLGNRPVDAVMKEVQPYLGSFGRAIPLPQSRQLLVVETAGKMETINVLINTVSEPQKPERPKTPEKPPAPVFAAYALGDLDPAVVLQTVKELIGSDRIAVDEKTQLLTAYLTPGQQTAVQSTIEKMQAHVEEAPANVSVAYPLRSTGEEDAIREQVTAIAPRATVSIDKKAARVLITAAPEDQQRLATAFSAMGISALDSEMLVKAFQVGTKQSRTISTALEEMIPSAQVVGNSEFGTVVVRGSEVDIALAEKVIERWRGTDLDSGTALHAFELPRPATTAWLTTVAKVVPQAQIWLDNDARQLILLGSADEKTRLENMLPQLLTALPAPPDRVLKTYPLSATELEQWKQFQSVLTAQLPEVRPILREASEDGSSELVVWATEDHQTRFAELINQVKQSTPEAELKWPKVFDLEKRDPSLFSELLKTRFPGVRVSIDPASKQMTVWAEPETLTKVGELLAQISDQLPVEPDLVLKNYRVEGRTPAELQTLLAPVIASVKSSQSRGSFQPIGTTTVDVATGRLMIMATEQAHQELDFFIQELGKPLPADQELILLAYSLDEAQPSDVKALIDQAVDGVTVIADDRRGQLVVTATLSKHGRIKTLISEVDRPASKYASEEIRAYELTDLQASSVLKTLQSMWPNMSLSADARSNRIVASGNAEDHEAFGMSIERLNMAPSGEEMRVQTYDVPMGDLRTLPTVLNQIAPQAIISTDAINRAIVVWASDEQHQRIGAAIEQLGQTAEGRREIEIYEVAPEKANILRYVVTSLFPTSAVGVDVTSGQLTVLASKEMQEKIAEVLAKTNKANEEGSKLEPRLYDTTESIRTAFTSVLKTTLPNATVITTGSTDPNKLMILASPEDHERAVKLLEKLSAETGPPPESRVQAYELSNTEPTSFQTLLAERHPQAKILGGAGTNRLVIAATEDDHAAITKTMNELELAFGEAGQRDLRVYQIRDDLTQQAVTGATTEVPRARLLPSNDPERIVLLASPTEHAKYEKWLTQLQEQVPEPAPTTSEVYPLEYGDPTGAVRVLQTLLPKVVFAADVRGKSVAATATAEDHETIQAFVKQYDDRQMDDAETKVFVLGEADATALSQAVTQMAPTAMVTPDRRTNRLIVTAPKDVLIKVTEAIESMDSDPDNQKTTKSYELDDGNTYSLSPALQTSFPRATISADYTNNRLIVSASEEEHVEIAKLFESLNSGGDKVTRSYALKTGSATSLRYVLQESFPKATIVGDYTSNSLVVSATEEVQEQIADFVDSMNVGGEKTTKNYQLNSGNATALSYAVRASFPKATISPDSVSNSLIVSANEEDHAQIAQVVEEMNADGKKITKNYTLDTGNAYTMRYAVQASFPKALVGADSASNSLIVAATEEEHVEIAELVKSINSEGKKITKNYALDSGNATTMRYAVQASFPKALVGSDSASNSLIVAATEEEHVEIAELVKSINSEGKKITKNYALDSGNASTMRLAVQASFPKALVGADSASNSLIVAATEEEHVEIAELVKSINSEGKRITKNYALDSGRASTMRLAVQASFPKTLVGSDSDSNSLIVSATEEEHAEIAELVKSINSEAKKITKSYPLDTGKASTMRLAVQASFPKTLVGSDSESNSLIVSATEEEHAEIAELVKSINSEGKRITKNYALETGRASTMRVAVQASFPKTLIGSDSDSNSLIVSATEEEHAEIAELVKSINSEGQRITKSYPLDSGSAASMRSAVQASFPQSTISADSVSNSLIVSATDQDHTQIEAFVNELNMGESKTTQSYVLENGNAATLRLALQPTFPQATIGADTVNDSLIVSATVEEHAEIAALVNQINESPARSAAMEAYPLSKASPEAVVDTLEQAFGRRTNVGVSADEESGTVFVLGLPREQEIAKQLIEQMDRIDPLTRDRRLKAFSLAGIDGDEVADAVQSLFVDARPEVEVRYDYFNEQLVVIATDPQLLLVEETLMQFDPPERELGIFPLTENDPNSVRDAINALFADVPLNDTPTITVDDDRQHLLIRATSQQLDEVRSLLGRLGETVQMEQSGDPGAVRTFNTNSRVRTITVGRDSESLLKQLQQVWPSLRRNPLRVIRSDEQPGAKSQPRELPIEQADASQEVEPAVTLVAMQDPDPAPQPSQSETDFPTEDALPEDPAVLILPGDGQWIIASEDTAALEVLAKLMEVAVAPPITPVAESGNLSVYVLQHGNAEDLEDLLSDLFRQSRTSSSRTRYTSVGSETRIVADTRINALVVQGSRADRGVIEDLLAVLDSPEFIDSLQLATPQLIAVQNTDAGRVETLLRTVYSSQLTRGRNRPQIEIPEGVSQEVASMLEQINAETSGPLLTLSVDQVSNSIVMRAPPELSEEIRGFVEQVDLQAIDNRAGKMRIIRLQGTNADQIERAIELMRGGRTYSYRRGR
ncbi:secretin N-terminal domain-containing protein [Novipirellula artificiosorum]|uniref:Bacterial type II/III secretion system short domain protein n=1 Tax=Novipirellula artificiosorum TaxID=2528016 RepID=A0A5C6DQH1_9BACT|nr:secretin N-terminal domain-containing protein [Novipirellula artificiosorum]TWU38475.1 Bacterial type II/III secretion system short domain protein [Novipirellula artificiosorum]